MKLIVNGRQMNVRDSLREMAETKLLKFDRLFGDEAEATVTFRVKHDSECIEITIRRGGTTFRSEECADTFQNAMDRAVEALLRQIRRNKTRLSRRLHDGTLNFSLLPDEKAEEETEFTIRRKSYPFKPMTPEEAVMQMNLLGHDFFVFIDGESGATAVVYRRKAGDYGLIVPSDEE